MEVRGKFDHYNVNVKDLDKSIAFYRKALGLTEKKRKEGGGGSFTLVYLGDSATDFLLELTWLRGREEPYNLGDNETHLCFRAEGNYDELRSFHREMGCICYENQNMGLYFIEDPDGYWIEIVKAK